MDITQSFGVTMIPEVRSLILPQLTLVFSSRACIFTICIYVRLAYISNFLEVIGGDFQTRIKNVQNVWHINILTPPQSYVYVQLTQIFRIFWVSEIRNVNIPDNLHYEWKSCHVAHCVRPFGINFWNLIFSFFLDLKYLRSTMV